MTVTGGPVAVEKCCVRGRRGAYGCGLAASVKPGHPPVVEHVQQPFSTQGTNPRTTRDQGAIMGKKKLTLSKETLRTLDEKQLSQIVGGDASGNHNPAKCPGSHHPNCR